MKLVVGLGNPGTKYETTKHNVGFMCLDYYANQQNESFTFNRKFNGETLKIGNLLLLKPHTYMNLSGESVRTIVDYFNIEMEDIMIIYDDLALPLGKIRIREKGGSGGHNGIKSLVQHLHTDEFRRVRIGIDSNPLIEAKDYVLGQFTKEELDVIVETAKNTTNIIDDFTKGVLFSNIMNKYN